MRVGAVISDLMLFSRMESAATNVGASLIRVDAPSELPDDLDLVLVDWSARLPGWTDALRVLAPSRVVLFGPHTDLEAHASSREAGLAPMWARSKLIAQLPELFTDRSAITGRVGPQNRGSQ